MGLVVFAVIGLYLLISIGVVAWAVRYARKKDRNPIRWGFGAVLVMYLIPFWDWIPTVVAHRYYCEMEAGFWVYKTPEQWRAENPGVMERLVVNEGEPSARQGDMANYVDTYFVNDRISLIVKHNGRFLFNRWRHEREILDTKRNSSLARYVDFSTSQEQQHAGWSGWKFWLEDRSCVGGRDRLIEFGNNYLQFKGSKK